MAIVMVFFYPDGKNFSNPDQSFNLGGMLRSSEPQDENSMRIVYDKNSIWQDYL